MPKEGTMMKKNLGSTLALYPMPLVVVGAMVDGQPTWTLAGHVGILAHDRVLVSLAKVHYINRGIRETGALSINLVDEPMLPEADYVGSVSGANIDKSGVFASTVGAGGAPVADCAKVSMACIVADIYETQGSDNFILEIRATYADEAILNEAGKIDYSRFHPVLFEMPTYAYLRASEPIAKCLSLQYSESERP